MTRAVLNARTAERLIKALGMLGSDHAGERAAAGRAADRLVSDSGLSWSELIDPQVATTVGINDLRAMARRCWNHAERFTAREREFIAEMVVARRATASQVVWLRALRRQLGGMS